MSDLTVKFFDRFHQPVLSIPNVDIRTDALVWETIGGPKTASFQITGDWQIDDAINFLGYHVEVYAPNGDCVWWGYVGSVKAAKAAVVCGIDLENMVNKMTVTYPVGAVVAGTYPAYVQTSIDRYGTRERQDTSALTNETAANQYRDAVLEMLGWPTPVIQHNPNNINDFIQLSCKGWYDSLAWQYYGGVTQASWGPETHHSTLYMEYFGNDVGVTSRAIAQKLTMQYTGTIDYVSLNFGWSGAPIGDCNIYIMPNGATPGAPGTELGKSKTDFNLIQSFGGYQNYDYKIEPAVSVTAGDQIWLVLDAGLDGGGSYKAWAKNIGTGTAFRQSLAGSWAQATGGDAFDMYYLFRIHTEPSIAIRDAILQKGQFLTGSNVPVIGGDTSSDTNKIPQTALAFISNLLGQGSANHRRLIPRVDRNRYLRVYEEPAGGPSAATLTLSRDGILRHLAGNEIFPPYQDPTGQWCVVKDFIPSSLGAVRNVDPTCFLIERAAYQGSTGGIVLTSRGIVNPLEVFNIQRK